MDPQSHKPYTLGSTRLTDVDVRAVIQLWGERQGVSDNPSVADVAEGLDITVEEVHALLEEVYARRTRVEIDVFEERERLAMAQRELVEEQARLARTERRLSQTYVERSDVNEQRLAVRRRRLVSDTVPPSNSALPAKSVSTRKRSLPDAAAAAMVMLVVGGLSAAVAWDLFGSFFR